MPRLLRAIHDFLAAFQFFTRIPVPHHSYDDRTVARASVFLPVVGLFVGTLSAALNHVLLGHWPGPIRAALVLTFMILITGAFHEDGLADTADGLGGGWTRERALEIMRDSRIGTYGAVALGLSLLLRWTLLSSLPDNQFWPAVVGAHVVCRWTTLPLAFWIPPARPSADGAGTRVAQNVSLTTFIAGTALMLVIAGLFLGPLRLALTLVTTSLVTAVSGLYYYRRLSGVTGDCFGTTNQLTEIAVYLVLAAH